MAQPITVWFDPEGDFLEVKFSNVAGYMRETDNDAVMERVDPEGNVIGFSIFNVIQLSQGNPLIAQLMGAKDSIS